MMRWEEKLPLSSHRNYLREAMTVFARNKSRPREEEKLMKNVLRSMSVLFCLLITMGSLPAQLPQPVHRKPVPQMRAYIDSIQRLQYQKPGEQNNIIVEFTDEPMFIARREAGLHKAVSPDAYLSQFSRFASDANAILSSFRSAPSDHLEIRHRYYKAFFGVSVTVPNWMLPMIYHLSYVKAVHFDKTTHALTDPAI